MRKGKRRKKDMLQKTAMRKRRRNRKKSRIKDEDVNAICDKNLVILSNCYHDGDDDENDDDDDDDHDDDDGEVDG